MERALQLRPGMRTPRLFLLIGVLMNLGLACSSTGGSGVCSSTTACPAGDVCIQGGTCAQSCADDGGTACPSGTTCQTASGFCVGTACTAIQVMVCR